MGSQVLWPEFEHRMLSYLTKVLTNGALLAPPPCMCCCRCAARAERFRGDEPVSVDCPSFVPGYYGWCLARVRLGLRYIFISNIRTFWTLPHNSTLTPIEPLRHFTRKGRCSPVVAARCSVPMSSLCQPVIYYRENMHSLVFSCI